MITLEREGAKSGCDDLDRLCRRDRSARRDRDTARAERTMRKFWSDSDAPLRPARIARRLTETHAGRALGTPRERRKMLPTFAEPVATFAELRALKGPCR